MRDGLFREEVLRAQRMQWLGSIRIGRPPSFTWIAIASIAIALAIITFSVLGNVTKKVRLGGSLIPISGVVQVAAPQSGIVSELLVKEGDIVSAGQLLLRIRSERTTLQGETGVITAQTFSLRRSSLEAERINLQQRAAQTLASANARIRFLHAEVLAIAGETQAYKSRSVLASKTLERFRELAKSGFVSDVQAQQKEEELLDASLRFSSAERGALLLQREINELDAEVKNQQASSAASISRIERELATLSQEAAENEARHGASIVAPKAGRISSLDLGIGQPVQSFQSLLTLIPNGSQDQTLEIQLHAPSRAIGFIKPGQKIWIRYTAYPYQKFGMARGEITGISDSPIPNSAITTSSPNEPIYRVRARPYQQDIQIYGERHRLRVGMTLEADVIKDRRAIWEWALEPLLSASSWVKAMGAEN